MTLLVASQIVSSLKNPFVVVRVHLYMIFFQGVSDAIVQEDTRALALVIGQCYILPSSFIGSPCYMIQQYQDSMAICRWAGCPYIFLTFMCNPRWKEIQHFLDLFPGQKAEDRPDVVDRVFHIKLKELMDEIKDRKLFGRVIAGNFFFQCKITHLF